MAKLARRKKAVTFDGAEYVISPLTYDELEEHGTKLTEFHKDKPDMRRLSDKQHTALQAITFFGICCGLNNADDDITAARYALKHGKMTKEEYEQNIKPLEITAEELASDMDDVLAGKLWREIFSFTGVDVPTEEEVKRRLKPEPEGEPKASS